MISTKRLVFKMEERLNSLSSNKHQSIPTQELLLMLNEAILKLIKQKIGSNNIYGQGIDSFRKRYQDLQTLILPHIKYNPLKTDLFTYIDLPKNLFLPVEVFVSASKGKCKNRVVSVTEIVPHSDVRLYLNSIHNRPSFNYQETFATVSSDKLIIYATNPEEGDFEINDVYLSYLRYPTKIELQGVPKIDGSVSTATVDSELPEYLEDEILDIAVGQAAMNTDNVNQVQFAQANQKNNE